MLMMADRRVFLFACGLSVRRSSYAGVVYLDCCAGSSSRSTCTIPVFAVAQGMAVAQYTLSAHPCGTRVTKVPEKSVRVDV